MTSLFKKLNFKDQSKILVLNHPQSFENELNLMSSEAGILTNLKSVKEIEFVLLFATMQVEIDTTIKVIDRKIKGDAVLWVCYPKGSSKKYKCDFNRDTGWASLALLNFEPVRMVAIDKDWSALRFRKVEYIKNITRRESHALTADAKKRTTQKDK